MTLTVVENLPRLTGQKRGPNPSAGQRLGAKRKIKTTEIAWVRYVAYSETAMEIVEMLAIHDRKTTGAPRRYDDFAMAVIYLLTGRMSTRMITESLLIQPDVWRIVLDAYRDRFGAIPPWEMQVAPTRRQWGFFEDMRLAPILDHVGLLQRSGSKGMALEMGMLNPSAPLAIMKPDRGHSLYGDGTVLGAVMKPKRPGSVIPGVIPEELEGLGMSWATEGGSTEQSLGHAYASLNIRLDDTEHRRIVLDVRPIREQATGGEAALGVQMICDFHDLLDADGRFDAVLWDGAMRGTNTWRIMCHTGAMPMHRVRTDDKPRPLELIRDCPCGSAHELFTDQQTICDKKIDGEGRTAYVPTPNQKILRRGRAGHYRVYLEFDLPCGTRKAIRVDQASNERGINVAERVQPIAPHQPGWKYAWRADAESRHAELDGSLRWKRMPYYKPANQDLFMLAEAMITNERAFGEWRVRTAEAQAS